MTYTPRLIAMDVNGQYLAAGVSVVKIVILQLISCLFMSYLILLISRFNQNVCPCVSSLKDFHFLS